MKLCDIRVGMLVKLNDKDVWAVAGVLQKGPSEQQTPVVLTCYNHAYGIEIKAEAYPSDLSKLTDEDM